MCGKVFERGITDGKAYCLNLIKESGELGGYEFLCLELLGGPGMLFVRFILLRDILESYPCCFFVQFEHLSAVPVMGWWV